jgi:hypothetical protein
MGAVPDRGAECGRLFGEHLCKAVHSALYHPHAVLFDVRHEHQGCGREVWRRSAIGRVAAEQLLEPRIAEVAAQRPPHGSNGRVASRSSRPPKPAPRTSPMNSGLGARTNERSSVRQMRALSAVKRLKPSASAFPAKAPIASADCSTSANRSRRPLTSQAWRASTLARVEGASASKSRPTLSKASSKHALERKNRRAGVDGPPAVETLAHLAAWRWRPLKHGHVEATPAEDQRRHQSADAGAHDNDVGMRHSCSPAAVPAASPTIRVSC